MMLELVQDGVVTLVAAGAAAVVVRRVLGLFRPADKPGCPGCPSAQQPCASGPGGNRPASAAGTHPVGVIRSPKR